MSYMEMLAFVFFIYSITLYSKAHVSGLFVVVFGYEFLALLLVVGSLGLTLFAVGFDILVFLLLAKTIVLDLSLAVVGVGVLGSEVVIGE